MEPLSESQAVILKGQDLGESHRIITLFTKDKGKLKAIARGAKRSKRRFLNALESFTLLKAVLKTPRTGGLFNLESIVPLETFHEIRMDVKKFACAGLCSELTDLWTREMAPEPELFTLMVWYLNELIRVDDPFPATIVFKTRLMKIAGYGPQWTTSLDPHIRGLSQATLRALDFIQNSNLDAIPRLRMKRWQMREAWRLLKGLHLKHLEHEPRSYKVLKEIAQGGAFQH